MHEIVTQVDEWLRAGEPVALATVIATWGSAPRGVGAKLAVTTGDRMIGSVSGGCVEAAVVHAARATLASGRPQRLSFGVSDETAWGVGLACGGKIEVLVERLDPDTFAELQRFLAANVAVASAIVLDGPEDMLGRRLLLAADGTVRSHLAAAHIGSMSELASGALRTGRCEHTRITLPDGDTVELFVDVIAPRPTLIMVGAGHIAMALDQLARLLGYRTVVVDPRAAFASRERFPRVDRLLSLWPEQAFLEEPLMTGSAVAVLSHDPKIDEPALALALRSRAYYVGALGSRATQAGRRERLRALGLTDDELSRLHGPIGLDIGARTPEEIALAIMAEIVVAHRAAASPSPASAASGA